MPLYRLLALAFDGFARYLAGKKDSIMADNKTPLALQRDPYGERILVKRFDWRDEKVLAWIARFPEFGMRDSKGNVIRQQSVYKDGKNAGKPRSSGALLRSIYWRTWNSNGGDMQVFEARYKYYAKFVELALGKGNPFKALPPGIPHRKWQPIDMPDRKRKARPSIPTEMRKQAAKFTTMLEDQFLFHGLAMIVYPFNNSINNQSLIDRLLYQKRAMRAANFM